MNVMKNTFSTRHCGNITLEISEIQVKLTVN